MNKSRRGFIVGFLSMCLFALASTTLAQRNKVFPIGKIVEIGAMMCSTAEAAKVVARLKGQRNVFTHYLVTNGWCVRIQGYGQYVKRIADEDEWAVWEVRFGDVLFYEATDWKPEGS